MGTTFTGMHVYTAQSIQDSVFSFRSFSEGWQTCTDLLSAMPWQEMQKQIRAFSARVNVPVLLFSLADGDEVYLSVYQSGKRIAYYDRDHGKNVYGIPAIFGIPEGGKRRLSAILACEGETATFLLEEYLGVCLLSFPEIQEEDPEKLRRTRQDTLWLRHWEEEKQLRGKHAPIRLTLMETIPGKLFLSPFGDHYRIHLCFLMGYGRPEDGKTLHWVRFAGGRLIPMEREPREEERLPGYEPKRSWQIEHGSPSVIRFTGQAPAAYAGRTMPQTGDLYPVGFDSHDRLYLGNERGSIAVVDDSLKIIARLHVKGDPIELRDDCILVTGAHSFYAYEYDPRDFIRLYRIEDAGERS